MAYLARTITPADGATDLFPVSFPLPPVQERLGVGVYVHPAADPAQGTAKVPGVDFSWVSNGQISFLPGKRPPANYVVDIRRQTALGEIDNLVQSGGSLRSEELVQNDRQLLYLMQERVDDQTDIIAQLAKAVEIASRDSTSAMVNVKTFGATGLGIANDGPAFVAALAYLKLQGKNPSPGGYYKGSPKLLIPAGDYYMANTVLDVLFSVVIEGEGSGWFGPGGGGSSRLRWDNGVAAGIRPQHPLTYGNIGYDPLTTHDASGGVVLINFMMQGGYVGTEGDFHALCLRSAVACYNLYIKGFSGEGVKAWAGNVIGFGNVGGNISTSLFINVKVEACRGGFDFRGSEVNLITTIGCQGYQNRWFNLLDDNGAGANTHIGFHAASGGLISFVGVYTQTSYDNGGGAKRYALKWGGNPLNAPTGAANDSADWLYINAGGPIANLIPAYVATPGLFRPGGDYLTINSASVTFVSPYSETGGFCQFTSSTLVISPTITPEYIRGGQVLQAAYNGMNIQLGPSGSLWLQTKDGEAGVWFQDQFGVPFGYVDCFKGGGLLLNSHTGLSNRIDGSVINTLDAAGLGLGAGQVIKINGLQVVGARGAALTRLTVTATAGALPAPDGTVTIANAATPTVAELLEYCTELEAKLELGWTRLRAATGHGLVA